MRFLNKSTLFLASVVVLLAIGFIFTGTLTMAHDGTHPLLSEITDRDNNVTTAAHYGHPVAKLTLKTGDRVAGKQVLIETDDDNTSDLIEDEFVVLVDFDEDIMSAGNLLVASGIGSHPFGDATDFAILVHTVNADGTKTLLSNDATEDTGGVVVARVGADTTSGNDATDDDDYSKFTVTINIKAAFIPSTATPKYVLTVVLNKDAGAYGLRKSVAGSLVDGGQNARSPVAEDGSASALEVYLVNSLDKTGPAATITGSQGSPPDRQFDVTIAFDKLAEGETLSKDDLEVTDGTVVGVSPKSTDATNKEFSATILPDHGVTAVTVQVKADVVKDALDVANAATPTTAESITVRNTTAVPTDPENIFEFTVPANTFVVLVRDITNSDPHSGQLQGKNMGFTDVPPTDVIEWEEMPDLRSYFDLAAHNLGDPNTGGGGLLVLRNSPNAAQFTGYAANPVRGSVGISEIMFGIDRGTYGKYDDSDRREEWLKAQWIEVHNTNGKPVRVYIYAERGADITDNKGVVGLTSAGDQIYDKASRNISTGITAGVLDILTNYFTGGDRGSSKWNVVTDKSQDGNSKTGENFISMERLRPEGGKHPFSNANKRRYSDRDGRQPGNWQKATTQRDKPYRSNLVSDPTYAAKGELYTFMGTPGHPNDYTPISHLTKDASTVVPTNGIIINEVANRDDSYKAYEWIELYNRHTDRINLRSYRISLLATRDLYGSTNTDPQVDNSFINFPGGKDLWVPAGGVLLLVASDPAEDEDHPLATGYNVDLSADDQRGGTGMNVFDSNSKYGRYKVIRFGAAQHAADDPGLPDDGNFVLVVRKPDDASKNDAAELGKDDIDKIVEVAGFVKDNKLSAGGYSNAVSSTKLWPLREFQRNMHANNAFHKEEVHRRQHKGLIGVEGTDNKPNEVGRAAFREADFTGIGYKRHIQNDKRYYGTPGHLESQRKSLQDDAKVVISEIMLYQGEQGRRRGGLPQWIELHNTSKTNAVNLHADSGWRLVIETPDINGRSQAIKTINFKNSKVAMIPPMETVLVVSANVGDIGGDRLGTNVVFPETRVLNVWKTGSIRNHIGMTDRTDRIVDQESFHIELIDGKGNFSDAIGNLDGNPRTNDVAKWKYPIGVTKDGRRTSLTRVYDSGVVRPAESIEESDVVPIDIGGKEKANMMGIDLNTRNKDPVIPDKYSWLPTSHTNFDYVYVRHTWYGSEDDFGTPANRRGQVLPVSLSFFRPALENGEVVIRWTTESELDNAGFNILRSETRNGEFKQVNTDLIQGNGTTGERSTYKWVDTTAKPGVVYYYQIEDVSFAGERQTLTVTKLKGLISAKNKLTTKWGELKEVQ